MNSDQNYPSSRIPKPIETAITAIGIALFIVFAFVGVGQAGDKRAVTGNNQFQAQANHDEELFANSDKQYLATAVVAETDNVNDTDVSPRGGHEQKQSSRAEVNQSQHALEQKTAKQQDIEKRSRED